MSATAPASPSASSSGVDVVVRRAGPADAAAFLAVVRAAFGARPPLDPPADALEETEASLADRLGALPGGAGLVAEVDGAVVGTVLLDRELLDRELLDREGDPAGPRLHLRRVGVLPEAQAHGVASALVAAALDAVATDDDLADCDQVVVTAREELPDGQRFWQAHGFAEVAREAPYLTLARPAPRRAAAPDAEAMRALGERLGRQLRAGDLVVLTGELGAGKTTFTQGLGAGLGVRGGVTSPTFVIARVHPSLGDGPDLVHVDAYRLGGALELDDLDLDASLEGSVTVVEWGAGLAEGLAESRLEVRIVRAVGEEDGDEPRAVLVDGTGPRWVGGLPDLRGV